MQQVTCKLLELDSRTHGVTATGADGPASADLRARIAAAEAEATELRAAASAHASELKLALTEAAQLRAGLEQAERRGAEEASRDTVAREAAEVQVAELSAASARLQAHNEELMARLHAAEEAREVAEKDVMELTGKCEDLAENCEVVMARCEEAERERRQAVESARRHAEEAAEAKARGDVAVGSERRLRARLQAAREGLRGRAGGLLLGAGSSSSDAMPRAEGPVAAAHGDVEEAGAGEDLCVELSLSGERGLARGVSGGESRASSRDDCTDASEWDEIMRAHEAEVTELRDHLAAARATGAMLTASAEEAEELQRRVEALEAERGQAAARNEVRLRA